MKTIDFCKRYKIKGPALEMHFRYDTIIEVWENLSSASWLIGILNYLNPRDDLKIPRIILVLAEICLPNTHESDVVSKNLIQAAKNRFLNPCNATVKHAQELSNKMSNYSDNFIHYGYQYYHFNFPIDIPEHNSIVAARYSDVAVAKRVIIDSEIAYNIASNRNYRAEKSAILARMIVGYAARASPSNYGIPGDQFLDPAKYILASLKRDAAYSPPYNESLITAMDALLDIEHKHNWDHKSFLEDREWNDANTKFDQIKSKIYDDSESGLEQQLCDMIRSMFPNPFNSMQKQNSWLKNLFQKNQKS